MNNQQIQTLLFFLIPGLLWLLPLQLRLRTLLQYMLEGDGNISSYLKKLCKNFYQWLFLVANLVVVMVIQSLIYESIVCATRSLSDGCTRGLLVVAILPYFVAPLFWLVLSRLFKATQLRYSFLAVVTLIAICFCAGIFLATVIEGTTMWNTTTNFSLFERVLSYWVRLGGPLSLLVAIIVVPLVSPLVAAVESVLGIKQS